MRGNANSIFIIYHDKKIEKNHVYNYEDICEKIKKLNKNKLKERKKEKKSYFWHLVARDIWKLTVQKFETLMF